MTTTLEYYGFLLSQLGVYLQLWFISGPMLLMVVLAACKNYLWDKTPFQKRHLLALLAYLFPFLQLAVGTLFEHIMHPLFSIPGWQTWVPWGLLAAQALLGLFLILRGRGLRLTLLALTLSQLWFSFFACLVALMSIHGIWVDNFFG